MFYIFPNRMLNLESSLKKYTLKNKASIYQFDREIDIFLSEIQFLKYRLCSFISIIIWFILILSC